MEEIIDTTLAFNHNEKDLVLACGLDKDVLECVAKTCMRIMKEAKSTSQIVEGLERELTRRELALFATYHITDAMQKARFLSDLREALL